MNDTYDFDELTPEEAQESYPAVWATVWNALGFLEERYVATIVSIVVDTCQGCYRSGRPCNCMRDE